MALEKIKGPMNSAQHAQRKTIHLKQPDSVDVVLIPLDYRAIGHGGVFNRHEITKRLLRDHKASRMLRKMPGKPHQLLHQYEHLAKNWAVRIQTDLFNALRNNLAITPPGQIAG